MTIRSPYRLTACAAVALLMGLGGCSGRDTTDSEKIAAIHASADRAEKAADRAEAALSKMRSPDAVATEDAEPEVSSTEPDDDPTPESDASDS